MSLLLKLLARVGLIAKHAGSFLFPKAGTDDDADAPDGSEPELDSPEEEPHDDPNADDEGDPESDPEPSALAGNGDAQPSRPSRGSRDYATMRARVQEAERKAQEAAERLERLERQSRGPSDEERERQAEEARLRDPDVPEIEKWQIRSNQTLRATQQQAQAALARATDDRDAAAYERKAAANPLYSKYADRVEKEVTRARQQSGQLVQREQVLAYLVGRDMIEGNLKSKPASGTKTVPRGKPGAARSDTPRTGGRTEADKRRARLENISI